MNEITENQMPDDLVATYMKRKVWDIQIKQYGSWMRVEPEVLYRKEYRESMADVMAHNFATLGWKATIPVHRIWSYMKPKDWWQALRERWFPAWWLKKWPVRYDTVTLDQMLDAAVPYGQSVFSVAAVGYEGHTNGAWKHQGWCMNCREPVVVFDNDGKPVLNPVFKPEK